MHVNLWVYVCILACTGVMHMLYMCMCVHACGVFAAALELLFVIADASN